VAKLIYSAITSLDGLVADESGKFDWAVPDAEVHTFDNDLATTERDISIGGPHLAAQALRAGLVDEIQLYLNPIVIGAGNPALPDDLRVPLELLDEHRFGNGVVFLRYRTTG
jgi:dihydrofolate reductase